MDGGTWDHMHAFNFLYSQVGIIHNNQTQSQYIV